MRIKQSVADNEIDKWSWKLIVLNIVKWKNAAVMRWTRVKLWVDFNCYLMCVRVCVTYLCSSFPQVRVKVGVGQVTLAEVRWGPQSVLPHTHTQSNVLTGVRSKSFTPTQASEENFRPQNFTVSDPKVSKPYKQGRETTILYYSVSDPTLSRPYNTWGNL